MVSILGADGQPIKMAEIREPQTAKLGSLHREFQGHPSRGLTPSRLAQLLEAAEQGDPVGQAELFEDMEEKDGHIAAEMSKRRRVVSGLEWDLAPPPNATAAEKDATERVKNLILEIPDLDEVLFDLTDAIGKAYACQEFEWHRLDGLWVPKTITHRPQSWFRLYRGGFRQEIRLRDHSSDGATLTPFGWITHTHKCKSGYLERAGLFRVLVWPYLFKNYSVADLAEWLEIYGIPLRLGKYPSGASAKEKTALLRALVTVGHNAAGIMPSGMEVDFKEAATGDADAFELMMDWCERTQSKVILGATLTSQADRGSNTNALGNIHDEVRKDLCDSDAKQAAATLTRDLVYPIAALNGWADGIRRSPRWIFDTAETEDIKVYADALPKLVGIGMRVSRSWAQQQIGIPEPEDEDDVLSSRAAPQPQPQPDAHAATLKAALDDAQGDAVILRQARARATAQQPGDYVDALVQSLADGAGPVTDGWLDTIRGIVASAESYDDLLGRLSELLTQLPLDRLASAIDAAIGTAGLAGRFDVTTEADDDA